MDASPSAMRATQYRYPRAGGFVSQGEIDPGAPGPGVGDPPARPGFRPGGFLRRRPGVKMVTEQLKGPVAVFWNLTKS
jgi:hypothetical protein